jgi:hypothetical protein
VKATCVMKAYIVCVFVKLQYTIASIYSWP